MNQDPVIRIKNFKSGASDEMMETSTEIIISDDKAKEEKALYELKREFKEIKEKSNFRVEEQELQFGEKVNDLEKIVQSIKAENMDSFMKKYDEMEALYIAAESGDITMSELGKELKQKKKELQITRLDTINAILELN